MTAKFLRELADLFEAGARTGSLPQNALPSKYTTFATSSGYVVPWGKDCGWIDISQHLYRYEKYLEIYRSAIIPLNWLLIDLSIALAAAANSVTSQVSIDLNGAKHK
jgi:hypothetical protein